MVTNQNKSWSTSDAEELLSMYRRGCYTVGEMASHFQRTEGAVIERLKVLGVSLKIGGGATRSSTNGEIYHPQEGVTIHRRVYQRTGMERLTK